MRVPPTQPANDLGYTGETLRSREQRLALIGRVVAEVAGRKPPRAIMARCLEELQQRFPETCVLYAEVHREGVVREEISNQPEGWDGRADSTFGSHLRSLWHGQEMVVVDDVERRADSGPLQPVARRVGAKALLACTISTADDRVSGLLIGAPEPYAWSQSERLLVQELCDILAIAVGATTLQGERGTAERQHSQALVLQAKKSAAIGAFIGGIAHDFNNVLGAIIGLAEVSVHMHPNSPLRSNLDGILTAGHRARELTKRIQAFRTLQKEALSRVEVEPEVDAAIELLEARLVGGARVVRDFQGPVGAVLCTPTQLQLLVMCLGENALQATADHATSVTVGLRKVRLEEAVQAYRSDLEPGAYVRLQVIDRGPGIPQRDQQKIFDPFFSTKEHVGAGLGLAMVREITRELGGGVVVESAQGQGCTVSVYLPCLREGREDAVSQNPLAGDESILFVDDEDDQVELGALLLGSHGYKVTTARSGAEALELVAAEPFALAIVDQSMPGMTGAALMLKLKERSPSMPVIMMTTPSGALDETLALELGADALICKPMRREELARAVRGLLQREVLLA